MGSLGRKQTSAPSRKADVGYDCFESKAVIVGLAPSGAGARRRGVCFGSEVGIGALPRSGHRGLPGRPEPAALVSHKMT
jgi:hypothetical protein